MNNNSFIAQCIYDKCNEMLQFYLFQTVKVWQVITVMIINIICFITERSEALEKFVVEKKRGATEPGGVSG